MADDKAQQPTGPDLKSGVDIESVAENSPLLGHVEGAAVMLVRQGENIFAIGATCTHYSGPLSEGLIVGETVRCPWHHARFNLRSGEAEGAPALAVRGESPTWASSANLSPPAIVLVPET